MPYGGMGGYQRAGGIGSFLSGLGKAAIGFVTGGPIGAVQAVLPHSTSGAPAPPSSPLPSGSIMPTPGFTGVAQRAIPGGQSGYQLTGPAMAPRGYHLNRSSYYTSSGFVPKGTKLVRNRSRNFGNGRALNKAVGRVSGFERMVKRSRKSLRKLASI
jgi:hypothetical protein